MAFSIRTNRPARHAILLEDKSRLVIATRGVGLGMSLTVDVTTQEQRIRTATRPGRETEYLRLGDRRLKPLAFVCGTTGIKVEVLVLGEAVAAAVEIPPQGAEAPSIATTLSLRNEFSRGRWDHLGYEFEQAPWLDAAAFSSGAVTREPPVRWNRNTALDILGSLDGGHVRVLAVDIFESDSRGRLGWKCMVPIKTESPMEATALLVERWDRETSFELLLAPTTES